MPILGNLKRTRYFPGRILTAEDFIREQTYFLDRARRHNRFLHGWGVISGLEVGLTAIDEVQVSPGIAIDCAGNEIAVPTPACIKINSAKARWFVALRYTQIEEGMIPAPGAADPQASLIRESFEVVLLETDPSRRHQAMGPGTPGCGKAHPLCLAALTQGPAGWSLMPVKSRTGP